MMFSVGGYAPNGRVAFGCGLTAKAAYENFIENSQTSDRSRITDCGFGPRPRHEGVLRFGSSH